MKKYILPILLVIGVFGAIAVKLKSNKAVVEERVYHSEKLGALVNNEVEEDAAAEGSDAFVAQTPQVFTGNFEPYKETKISAQGQGNINKMLVDVGSNVALGQSLIQLDDALLRLQLRAVEVQIEGLEADVRRYTVLAKADAIQAVQLEKANLGLKTAQVQRATIEEQIAKTTVKAPFGGTIVAKLSEEGGFAAPGVPLLQLIDISQLRFTINVPENDLKQFKIGQTHRIIADAYPQYALTGRVIMIGSRAGVGNTFPIQFRVQNIKQNILKAGMFGTIEL